MMVGGDDGTDKAARTLARRPTIRARAVTPPRTATPTPTPTWKLPPVRPPSPRGRATEAVGAAARPVLLLVADASDQFEVARLHDDRASSAFRPAKADERAASSIPVFDVKSLPPAPRRK
jgi:hypothetical protein